MLLLFNYASSLIPFRSDRRKYERAFVFGVGSRRSPSKTITLHRSLVNQLIIYSSLCFVIVCEILISSSVRSPGKAERRPDRKRLPDLKVFYCVPNKKKTFSSAIPENNKLAGRKKVFE